MGERSFAPLGMRDTAFDVPPEKMGRLAKVYRAGPDGKLAATDDVYAAAHPDPGRLMESGGGGLFLDRGRLRPLRPDAPERRHARRAETAIAQDRRADDGQPPGPARAATSRLQHGDGLRSRRRGARRPRGLGGAGGQWGYAGWRGLDLRPHRPDGEARRDPPGPAVPRCRTASSRASPTAAIRRWSRPRPVITNTLPGRPANTVMASAVPHPQPVIASGVPCRPAKQSGHRLALQIASGDDKNRPRDDGRRRRQRGALAMTEGHTSLRAGFAAGPRIPSWRARFPTHSPSLRAGFAAGPRSNPAIGSPSRSLRAMARTALAMTAGGDGNAAPSR